MNSAISIPMSVQLMPACIRCFRKAQKEQDLSSGAPVGSSSFDRFDLGWELVDLVQEGPTTIFQAGFSLSRLSASRRVQVYDKQLAKLPPNRAK